MNGETGDCIRLDDGHGEVIEVRWRPHPRARRVRLTVDANGARVSSPPGTSENTVRRFVRQNRQWIRAQLARRPRLDERPPLRLGVADAMSLCGSRVALRWQDGAAQVREEEGAVVVCLPAPWSTAREPLAGALMHDFLGHVLLRAVHCWLPGLASQLGRQPAGLRIRPMKSLWGSLGVRGHLSLDMALALAPPAVQRAVLVHELAHLVQRNHSRAFWAQVEALMPEYREPKAWLSEHGSQLKADAARLLQPVATTGTQPASGYPA